MNVACIIPARGGSKGIPKKNIINFLGNPLISYTIEQAKKSKNINKIFVTSDDTEILEISKNFGVEIIVRPKEISDDISSSESALLHAISEIEKTEKFEIYVFLQVTSPLRDVKDIECSIEKLINEKLDSLFSVCKIEDFLVWSENKGDYNSVNYDFESRKRRQDVENQFVENGSIYVFEKNGFLNKKNRIFGKKGIFVMDKWKMFEIDNLEDLEFCSLIYKLKLL